MENLEELYQRFACPNHKGEGIQRISDSVMNSQPLYCLECIVQANKAGVCEQLLKLDEYIKSISKDAKPNFDPNDDEDIPVEINELISKKADVLQRVKDVIVADKLKIKSQFDSIEKDIQLFLTSCQTTILHKLDNALETLQFNYTFVESSALKWFKGSTSSPESEVEGIHLSIISQQSTQDLEKYIKLLNRDSAENRLFASQDLTEDKGTIRRSAKEYIVSAAEDVKLISENIPPTILPDIINLKHPISQIELILSEAFREAFTLDYNIEEIPPFVRDGGASDSCITSRFEKDKALHDGIITPDKFNFRLQRLRMLLNETSTKIYSPPSKVWSHSSRSSINKFH